MAPISNYNFVLESLVKVGSYPTVFSLFNKLDESTQDIHTWAILIKCHSVDGNMSSAISLFHKIIDTGHHPTAGTLYSLLYGFCDRHQIHKAMHFYNYIILKKGFQLDHKCYLVLIKGLCKIGETHTAIQLLRRALQTDEEGDFTLLRPDSCTYSHLVYGYCILGQFKQAIDFFIELEALRTGSPTHPPTLVTAERDVKSAIGQFKEALDLLIIELEASRTAASPTPPTLVTERDVKSARSVAAVMIKGGVKPNVACYRSVYDGLYKGQGGSKSNLMNKIEKKVKKLLLSVPYEFNGISYD
ncbi:pentatricopeptide repeat-containing protein At1g12620 [Medicago truncatula]|uniref:pentatricopeptide repeat-containing protein At1g12620 n=1 Tax=Medicago truncatula TaxID=3880 RepID=UPI000D2F2BD6|nr:pentatricopeptide repeat-containing protein At1g12620 [Medicago truncatula]